jgi:RIO-like serine/threonine protein kinase
MKSPLQELKQLEMQYTGPRELSLKEVQQVTGKFKQKIGEGGFGAVYYGVLSNGTAVAVKVGSLNRLQGTKEFTTEARIIFQYP